VTKGRILLEHSLGLGARENVVPPGEPSVLDEPREVILGWHPVLGLGGKWFAEQTGLGKKITETVRKYPDPTQHWAVLVGDYAHELWMDEKLDIIYINEVVKEGEWTVFQVGKTKFNDEAIRQTGESNVFLMD